MNDLAALNASQIATGIGRRSFTAVDVVTATLDRIVRLDPGLNCFTNVMDDRALQSARRIDANIANGKAPGPLAGVPYAVKALFDVAGYPTHAGSKIHQDAAPATADAGLVRRLDDAGAVLVGAVNMDEYACGFMTENAHFGATHNPHDPSRVAGGSSGGAAAAVAAGLSVLALGTDTNGSIRVPAAFCGVFGLKPTFGRLSRAGAFAFVDSLDHTGLFARTIDDLATVYEAAQGRDPADRAQADRPFDPVKPFLNAPVKELRIGILDGWFRAGATPDVLAAVDRAGHFLSATTTSLPAADIARAAAFCITAAEGATLHLSNLKTRPQDFDPATRDRLLAGALLPAPIVIQAQRFRTWFQAQIAQTFKHYDALIAPTTPFPAPRIGQETIMIGGEPVLARPHIGIYTQPLSFIGLPVLNVPVCMPGELPVGIQIIAAPWAEATAFQVASVLEQASICTAPIAGAMSP